MWDTERTLSETGKNRMCSHAEDTEQNVYNKKKKVPQDRQRNNVEITKDRINYR